MNRIAEADWRLLSKLKPVALDRLCERVLAELQRVASDTALSHHERYLKIYTIIEEQDKKIAYIFNGLSRSHALSKLARMREEQLITHEEMAKFSSEARASIAPELA